MMSEGNGYSKIEYPFQLVDSWDIEVSLSTILMEKVPCGWTHRIWNLKGEIPERTNGVAVAQKKRAPYAICNI